MEYSELEQGVSNQSPGFTKSKLGKSSNFTEEMRVIMIFNGQNICNFHNFSCRGSLMQRKNKYTN